MYSVYIKLKFVCASDAEGSVRFHQRIRLGNLFTEAALFVHDNWHKVVRWHFSGVVDKFQRRVATYSNDMSNFQSCLIGQYACTGLSAVCARASYKNKQQKTLFNSNINTQHNCKKNNRLRPQKLHRRRSE